MLKKNRLNAYRYGFNGKEKDSDGEWGSSTHYDYGFRIYNPSIGRFLSVDPLRGSYPMLTPYQFASNRPIDGIDLDGLEFYKSTLYDIDLVPVLSLSNQNTVAAKVYINEFTQRLDFMQAAAKYERRIKPKKTITDGAKSLVSLGLEFKSLGINSSSNLGRSLGAISKGNAFLGIFDEFKKVYDKGKTQGELLNYTIVSNMMTRDKVRAEWVVEIISIAQSEGIISGNEQQLKELLNFALDGDVPLKSVGNGSLLKIPDSNKKDRLLSQFNDLTEFIEKDKDNIVDIKVGRETRKFTVFKSQTKVKPK